MELREERPDDHEAVRDLHLRAFGTHGTVVAALVEDLRAALATEDGRSLVAALDGTVVGHVMITRSLLDAARRLVPVQVLSPLAVDHTHRGQGVGSALVRAAIEAAAGLGAPVLFLEGPPDYYGRFGFAAGGPLGFRSPSLRIPDGAFQALRLPAWQPWMTGTLVYRPTFWDHDAVGLRDQAAEEGRPAEFFQLVIDCHDPGAQVAFWQPVLGYRVPPAPDGHATWREWYLALGIPAEEIQGDGTDRLVPPHGRGPALWFQPVPEGKSVKNRLHLDLRVSGGRSVPRSQRRAEVDAAVREARARGAVLLSLTEDEDADHVFALMADPEGNEFCFV